MISGYKHRELAATLSSALETMPVVVLTGMRQTGKSTILTNDPLLKDGQYLNLDDMNTLEALKENPESAIVSDRRVTIDEVQRIPDLFTTIKLMVDKKRRPGMFLLSGSANPGLLRGVTESLAGRAIYYELLPMSRREITGITKRKPFLVRFFDKPSITSLPAFSSIKNTEVERGGIPPVALGQAEAADIWFKGYEQTYLERDLRDIARVDNIIGFRRLLKLAAHRTAQLLNISELARDCSLPVKTAYRYLGWMEASFLITRILPFLGNRQSRLIKSPKLFITDSGLARYLMGEDRVAGSPSKGALFETYAAQNLLSIIGSHMPRAELYFWNIHSSYEVDFVIENVDESIAIEVKSGTKFDRKDLTGLRAFIDSTPGCKAAVIAHNGETAIKIDDKLWAIPLGLLLS